MLKKPLLDKNHISGALCVDARLVVLIYKRPASETMGFTYTVVQPQTSPCGVSRY